MKRVIGVIPARMASSRLPGKVLADINGQPMLWHVWQRASMTKLLQAVLVATDSIEIMTLVEGWGGQAMMTSPNCRSGTERIVSILDQLPGDFILNIQGDEPLILSDLLDSLVVRWQQIGSDIVTPVYPIRRNEDLFSPDIVKVVRAKNGAALYFSRSPIPHVRDCPQEQWLNRHVFWGHVGVYGYHRSVLEAYGSLADSSLEFSERLEQLRFLDNGFSIQTVETDYQPIAVDTASDLARVRRVIGALR